MRYLIPFFAALICCFSGFTQDGWEQLKFPTKIKKMRAEGALVYALSDSVVYMSEDFGTTWQTLSLELRPGYYDMDLEDGVFYLANQDHVWASTDEAESFERLRPRRVDVPVSIDFVAGYGWSLIRNWGNYSGPNKISPNGMWETLRSGIPYEFRGALRRIVADVSEPNRIAYIMAKRDDVGRRYYRTENGGDTWIEITHNVHHATEITGQSHVIATTHYSVDDGETWIGAGIRSRAAIKKPGTQDSIFAAREGSGMYLGVLGRFRSIGLCDQVVFSLAVNEKTLFGVTTLGEVYKISMDDIRFVGPKVQPLLESPSHSETMSINDRQLSWDKVLGANSYVIELTEEEPNFEKPQVFEVGNVVDKILGLNEIKDSTWYYWRIKARGDCWESSWSEIRSFFVDLGTSTLDKEVISSFQVYPNPVVDRIFLRSNLAREFEVRLYDTAGKLLIRKSITEQDGTVQMADYPSGPYLLEVVFAEGRLVRKIMKAW